MFKTIKLWLAQWGLVIMAGLLASALLWGGIERIRGNQSRSAEKALSEALAASEAENETLRKVRVADDKSIEIRTKEVRRVTTKEAKAHEEVAKAAKENPDWANAPIPPAVLDSLR